MISTLQHHSWKWDTLLASWLACIQMIIQRRSCLLSSKYSYLICGTVYVLSRFMLWFFQVWIEVFIKYLSLEINIFLNTIFLHFLYFVRYCPIYSVTLQPGDVLYNPPWWGHAIRNITDKSVAISNRYKYFFLHMPRPESLESFFSDEGVYFWRYVAAHVCFSTIQEQITMSNVLYRFYRMLTGGAVGNSWTTMEEDYDIHRSVVQSLLFL